MRPSTVPASITLGLDLSTSAGLRRLTFAPGDDRVFTVGSAVDADIRVEGPGIEPVHFTLERHNDELWLVPARREQRVLVDARRVNREAPLGVVAVIEFAEQRIVATSYPTNDAVVSAAGLTLPHGPSAIRRVPGEADLTRPALPAAERDVTHLLATQRLPAKKPTPPVTAPSFSGSGFTERISANQLYRPPAAIPGEKPPGLPEPDAPAAGSSDVASSSDVVSSSELASSPDTTPPPEPKPHPKRHAPLDPTVLNARAVARTVAPAGEQPAARAAAPRESLAAAADPTVVSRGSSSTGTLEVRLREVARRLRAPADRRRRQRGPLDSLGRFAQRRPLMTAALVLAVAGAVAVPLAFADKIRRPQAPTTRQAPHPAPMAIGQALGPTPALPHSTLNPTPEPPLAAPPARAPAPPGPSVQIVSPSPAASAATSAPAPAARASRGPVDAAVVDAVGALALGRDGQAKLAYERLATRSPENPAYRVLAALLERFTSAECADPATARACPEVKR